MTVKLDNGSKVVLTLVRGKNKLRDVDPTHFRNVLLNLRLQLDLS